jgi:hypothetical protein
MTNSSGRLIVIAAIVALQGMMIATMHTRHYSGSAYVEPHYPARKEFAQDVHKTETYTTTTYWERLYPAGGIESWLGCGTVYQEKWVPKLHDNKEGYTSLLNTGSGYESRDFSTLAEAEQFLFSRGCPSTKWGRK